MVQAFTTSTAGTPAHWNRFRSLLPVITVVVIAIGAAVAIFPILNGEQTSRPDVITTGFSIAMAVLLSMMPAVICTVQNVSLRRQRGELATMQGTGVAATTLYLAAQRSMSDDNGDAWIDDDYVVPTFVFFLVCFFAFLAMFLGYGQAELYKAPTVFLGGLQRPPITIAGMTPDPAAIAAYTIYQRETFCVVAMALAGAYAYALGRILDRINNNDLYPISLYYYGARIIIACIVAAVLRHTILVLNIAVPEGTDTALNPLLLLLGFIVGFTPDLFIIAISRKAFQMIKVWGSRPNPEDTLMPSALPLLVIDDLTREKIDRLNEIGIDNAQVLARQNPFMMLPRLPYDLSLLVDWVAQAQLYALVKDERLRDLRKIFIRTIVDLHIRLKNETASKPACAALGIDPAVAPALVAQLEADPYFMQLKELSEALHPAKQA